MNNDLIIGFSAGLVTGIVSTLLLTSKNKEEIKQKISDAPEDVKYIKRNIRRISDIIKYY